MFLFFMGTAKAQTPVKTDFHDWALTPPMGWNSWDCFGPSVVESEVKANADYMAANLKEFGWEYVVVDIRWYVDNQTSGHYNSFDNSDFIYDEYGRYMPSPTRFPSAANGAGFKPLADYVHNLGLKFGIHMMRGVPKVAVSSKSPILGTSYNANQIYSTSNLCTWLFDNYTIVAGKPGAQEYYNSIFELYASWGVDYVKVDDLSRPYHADEIEMIRKAIDNSGRPIVLSMSPGATPLNMHEHAKNNANLWRTVDDLWDNWTQLNAEFSVCANWAPYISPGAWPDADMLPLGKFIRGERATNRYTNFSKDESYTLMTLWSIFKSPLMFGGNLPDNDAFTDSIITNVEVLDIHKRSVDNLQWFVEGNFTAWTANDPENGYKYIALFNRGSVTDEIEINLKSIGFDSYTMRDLWKQEDLGTFTDSMFTTEINFHGAKLFRISAPGRSGNTEVSLIASSKEITTCDSIEIKVTPTDADQHDLSGWVQIFNGDSLIENVKVDSKGEAQFPMSLLGVGHYRFSAEYGGNPWFLPQVTNDTFEVNVIKGLENIYEELTICENDLPYIYYADTLPIGTTSGNYNFSLISEKGCDYDIFLDLAVNPTFQTELYDTICRGESVVIENIYLTKTGIYTFNLLAQNGCDSIVIFDLTVLPKNFTLLKESICMGESYTFRNQNYTESGTYRDTLINQHGCDSVLILDLDVFLLPDVYIGNDTTITEEQEIILDAGEGYSSYSWNTGAVSQTISVSGLSTGEYQYAVKVTNFNECSNSDTVVIYFTPAVGIDDVYENHNILVYPNPAKNSIYLKSNTTIDSRLIISIYNETGQLLIEKEVKEIKAGRKIKVDISMLKAGIYLIKINNSKSFTIHKIIKE